MELKNTSDEGHSRTYGGWYVNVASPGGQQWLKSERHHFVLYPGPLDGPPRTPCPMFRCYPSQTAELPASSFSGVVHISAL